MVNPIIYNSFDPNIPEPIAFSGWKHHLGFISTAVSSLRGNISEIELKSLCSGIRGSVIDLYTGSLSSDQIASEVKNFLEINVGLDLDKFKKWINESNGYQLIVLSDESSWTLRIGSFKHRFIHIHPSRYSRNSIRVKSTTLRTAIAYCLIFPNSNENPQIVNINSIRNTLLNLPPLKEDVLYHSIFQLVKFIHR